MNTKEKVMALIAFCMVVKQENEMKTKRVSMYGVALVTALFASSALVVSAATPPSQT